MSSQPTPTVPTKLNESCILVPRAYIDSIVERLDNYGNHRDEIFMTRKTAKEAATLIKLLVPEGCDVRVGG